MLQKGVKKVVFDKYFYKRDNILKRRIEIDASLYERLKELSNIYEASINKLVNVAIMEMVETNNVNLYDRPEKEVSESHNFNIRESAYKELERLAEALMEIDKSLEEKQNENISVELLKNKRMYSIYETDLKEKNTVNLFDSKDCISGEFVFLYPPGIPLVVPGEVITEELLEQIKVYLEANMNISGLKDNSNKTIEVVK